MRSGMIGYMSTQHLETPIPVDDFPMRLAIARHHAGGISAKDAAERVGVAGQTWRNWEDGQHLNGALRPSMLRYIAEQLGVDEAWLRHGGALASSGSPEVHPVEPSTMTPSSRGARVLEFRPRTFRPFDLQEWTQRTRTG